MERRGRERGRERVKRSLRVREGGEGRQERRGKERRGEEEGRRE